MRDEVLKRLSELANDVVSELGRLGDEDRVPLLMSFFKSIVWCLGYGPFEVAAMFELLKFEYLYETLTEAYMQVKEEKGGDLGG